MVNGATPSGPVEPSGAGARGTFADGLFGRIPAPVLFIGSGFTQYIGAAIAVSLFLLMPPYAVSWWRLSIAAVVLLLWRRPWRESLTWRELVTSGIFGVVMAGMNTTFYLAVAHLELGVAVSLEFVGPVLVAILTRRNWKTTLAALSAFAGVVLISGFGLSLQAPGVARGVAFALAAGALWAGYILLGRRIAATRSGVTSLAVGCAVASVVYLPLARLPRWPAADANIGEGGASWVGPNTAVWVVAILIILVGVLSTVLPYSLEQVALARVDAATFALLTSLLPATSLLTGAVMLGQFPEPASIAGLVFISFAVWLASQRAGKK